MNGERGGGAGFNRRRFLQIAGGGVVVALIGLGARYALKREREFEYPEDLNAYLRIGRDGRVTVFSGKIEMGQGVMTSLAQMLAEELGVAVATVDMVMGDTQACPPDAGTFGSLTTRVFGPALREAGAKARSALFGLAARRLGVPRTALRVQDGVVSVIGAPSRHVTYADLAGGAKILRVVDRRVALRTPNEFTVIGDPVARLDGPAKVTGAAKYAGDLRLPGMLYARLLRPPMHGAILMRIDTSAAARVPGARIVQHQGMIAALHADPQAAEVAVQAIRADWSEPATTVDSENIFAHLVAVGGSPDEIAKHGDVDAARARAPHRIRSVFHKGYVAHAPMEPHAALAEVKDGRATVWASTQTPFPTRDHVAEMLGLGRDAVRVITPFVGGGFGGKIAGQQVLEAARLAQLTGQPVMVEWTREEEFFYDTFDPAAVVEVVSAADPSGRIALWDYAVFGAGPRGAAPIYASPNQRIVAAMSGPNIHPFAVGPWRAPGANMNVWARESQVDLMAAALGQDPLEFRLRNVVEPRLRRALEAVAAAFGWQSGPAPTRRGQGIACNIDAGTCVATAAAVRVDAATGRVIVDRIVCAQDMGVVVNPEGAKMQIEGGLTMGLGYTLAEELHFMGGNILDRNFGTYRIPRFSWVPRIETILLKNDALAPQGGGEPAITTTGAVVANAVFDATGVRFYRLPMTPVRVKDALATSART